MVTKTPLPIAPFLALSRLARAESIDLAGAWGVALAEPGPGSSWQTMRLPGTLDDEQLGTPLGLKPALTVPVLAHLQRRATHLGPAWFKREVDIPGGWAGKTITLELERALGESRVFVDHREIHREVSLHLDRYEVPASFPAAHACTNHTQTRWNGALRLRAVESGGRPGPGHVPLPAGQSRPHRRRVRESSLVCAVFSGQRARRRFRASDPRRPHTSTISSFQNGPRPAPEPADKYLIVQYTVVRWIRGRGVFNDRPPVFAADYRATAASSARPPASSAPASCATPPPTSSRRCTR